LPRFAVLPPPPPIDYSRPYSLEEFLTLDDQADQPHELWNGQITPKFGFEPTYPDAMAGATTAHSLLVQNCTAALRARLRGQKCRTLGPEMRVLLPHDQIAYPDVVVTNHPAEQRLAQDHLRNPLLIVEVLAPATQARDREQKLDQYRLLPSLRQFVLVSQHRIWVESYTRTTATAEWASQTYTRLADILLIPMLYLSLPLQELYDEVDLSPLRVA
jgi:Uma2 family endonuclease